MMQNTTLITLQKLADLAAVNDDVFTDSSYESQKAAVNLFYSCISTRHLGETGDVFLRPKTVLKSYMALELMRELACKGIPSHGGVAGAVRASFTQLYLDPVTINDLLNVNADGMYAQQTVLRCADKESLRSLYDALTSPSRPQNLLSRTNMSSTGFLNPHITASLDWARKSGFVTADGDLNLPITGVVPDLPVLLDLVLSSHSPIKGVRDRIWSGLILGMSLKIYHHE